MLGCWGTIRWPSSCRAASRVGPSHRRHRSKAFRYPDLKFEMSKEPVSEWRGGCWSVMQGGWSDGAGPLNPVP